jgi:hypothetical protein
MATELGSECLKATCRNPVFEELRECVLGGATVPWGTDHWPKAAGLKPESCSASSRNAERDDPACLAPESTSTGTSDCRAFRQSPVSISRRTTAPPT